MKRILTATFVFGSIFVYAPSVFAATSTNLVINPSVETAASADPNMPMAWNMGSWGANNAVFTYPVLGYDGSRAVEVNISSYTSGDAKWYADDIPVVSTTTYAFSDAYQSNATTSVVVRYTSFSGQVSYIDLLTEVPPSPVWKTQSLIFTVPTGTRSISVWHLLNRVGTLTTDAYSIIDRSTSTSTTDTIPPSVSLTFPTLGATVTGNTNITASASDNVGVRNVDFFLDGTTLLGEDATFPYQAMWNTLSAANGLHTLTAFARDTSGNATTSSPISVNVSNNASSTTTSTNLIANPSLEVFGPDSLPVDWSEGNWGTNNAIFSYTSTSSDGAASGRIDVTSYTDGDAKWYFKNVPVTPNTLYTFSDYYQASVRTAVVIRYSMTDGSFRYVDLPNVLATPMWKRYTASFTSPTGAVSLTIFHLIAQRGSLSVDSFSLVAGSGVITDPELFAQGMVSLTFDDGWISHYTAALPILRSSGLRGVFAIISQETIQALSGNLIANPSFESPNGATSSLPLAWNFATTGNNNGVANYPIAGQSGPRAGGITISSYQSGGASWSFDDASVIPNQNYTYSEYYNSSGTSTLTLRIHYSNDTYTTLDLDTLSPTSTWTKYTKVFKVPESALTLTIFQRLTATGTLAIDNTMLERVQVYVDPSMVLAMQTAGNEIASHTQHHPSLLAVSSSTMLSEVNNSKTDLTALGVKSVQSFVYPYGDYNSGVELAAKNAGYIGARSVERGYNIKTTDRYALKIQQVGVNDTPAQIESYIDTAVADRAWLILMYHQIGYGGEEYGATPETLQANANYLAAHNVPVVTMAEGLGMMNP